MYYGRGDIVVEKLQGGEAGGNVEGGDEGGINDLSIFDFTPKKINQLYIT